MAEGLQPSTIRNALMPLRAIYRYALALDEVAVNPTTGIQLPAVRGRRERIAPPDEAARLIAVLPDTDRAIWATAMYAGLRAGELQALRAELVDLDANVIRVQWSWDPKAGRVAQRAGPAAGRCRSLASSAGISWSIGSLAVNAKGYSSGGPTGSVLKPVREPARGADLATRRPETHRTP